MIHYTFQFFYIIVPNMKHGKMNKYVNIFLCPGRGRGAEAAWNPPAEEAAVPGVPEAGVQAFCKPLSPLSSDSQ